MIASMAESDIASVDITAADFQTNGSEYQGRSSTGWMCITKSQSEGSDLVT